MLADELLAKASQSLETCVLANNSLSGKLVYHWNCQSHLMKDLKLL